MNIYNINQIKEIIIGQSVMQNNNSVSFVFQFTDAWQYDDTESSGFFGGSWDCIFGP